MTAGIEGLTDPYTGTQVVDAIAVPHGDWADDGLLRHVADAWAAGQLARVR
jgi:hypothetical protein